MQTTFKDQTVTRLQMLAAMEAFDGQYADSNDYENWLSRASYKYVVWHDGRRYPPKHILSSATGIPTSEFSGGDQTNRVFESLGFTVTNK